jgi:hypothetical protein
MTIQHKQPDLLGLIDRYIDLKAQQKAIEGHLNEIKPILEQSLQGTTIKRRGYKLYLATRETWNYSPDALTEIESIRLKDKAQGKALPTYTTYLGCKKDE